MSEEDIREVVSAVTYSPEKDRFLLLKRSGLRKKFPDKWEFPSGFMENESEQEGALRELKEETGLMGEIIRTGKSFGVKTEKSNFRIHPVLIKVGSEGIELTEEHEEFKWIELEEIDSYNTVPQIKENLKSVDVL